MSRSGDRADKSSEASGVGRGPAPSIPDQVKAFIAYPGATTPWPEKLEEQQEAEEELLQRLVDLNHQRAAEEAQGKIRWLRPEYQARTILFRR